MNKTDPAQIVFQIIDSQLNKIHYIKLQKNVNVQSFLIILLLMFLTHISSLSFVLLVEPIKIASLVHVNTCIFSFNWYNNIWQYSFANKDSYKNCWILSVVLNYFCFIRILNHHGFVNRSKIMPAAYKTFSLTLFL